MNGTLKCYACIADYVEFFFPKIFAYLARKWALSKEKSNENWDVDKTYFKQFHVTFQHNIESSIMLTSTY